MPLWLFAGAPALGKDPELPSSWRTADVTIDGAADDWSGKLVPIGSSPVFAGVQNDGSFVYLCFKTSDEATRKQILAVGLSIYLDASGKDGRTFGIRYPIGSIGAERRDVPDSGNSTFERQLSVSVAGAELVILGREEADLGRMRVSEARPIEAAMGEADGALVIELKVPLVFSVETPHSVDAKPGATISLGVESTQHKVKRSKGGDDEPIIGGGSGMGMGRGGGMGRGMGGAGRGGRGERSSGEKSLEKTFGKPIKVWLSIPLAAAPKT